MITFADLQAILDGIADNAALSVDGGGCPHKRFWRVNYNTFLSGEVPNIVLGGVTYHIKIVDNATPINSPFYNILLGDLSVNEGANSWTISQMPEGGPFITDTGYSITVGGNDMTGDEIKTAIGDWLNNAMPE